ncbi:conserved hypothetical protein [delta proteobacterium NaphS2]|nr:conserved hypothetical protein [delta proteobacterium NaphS2]
MIVTCLFSSPEGDILLDPEDLSRPFLLTPEKAHPHLTLGDYFDTMRKCILDDGGELLKGALKSASRKNFNVEEIQRIQIRSEKHGLLYHLASVEVITAKVRVKFTLSTAISPNGIDCILQEHDILQRLNRRTQFSFLPEIYGIRKTSCRTAGGKAVEMVMLAAQWFEDYHEWHVTTDPSDHRQKIEIWDLKRGPRYASSREAALIIEECSKILACYYDYENFDHIGAWHHAAGDFIVKCPRDGKPEVKLTTVRNYAPLMAAFSGKEVDPTIAILYFFLDTTVRMRLDRLDGVGEMVWLDDFAVGATVKGFFEGLRLGEIEGDGTAAARADNLLSLLQSFDQPEFIQVFDPLLAHYAAHDSNNMHLIGTHITDHMRFLRRALQDFHWSRTNSSLHTPVSN